MSWKKIAVSAGIGAAVLGAGTAALATTTGSTTVGQGSEAAAASGATGATGAHRHAARGAFRDAVHAQWVTRDAKTGEETTHEAIKGSATAVSATSITVKAVDGTTESYAVTSTTLVHSRGDGKGSTGQITSQVKVGDAVVVAGTGTSSFTAKHVFDRVDAPATPTSASPSASPSPTSS